MGCDGKQINEGSREVTVQQAADSYARVAGLISDTVERQVMVDGSTHALEAIEHEHHEVHGGNMFSVFLYDADLDSGDKMSISFKTPDTEKYFHFVAVAQNTSASLFELLEGPTITVDSGVQVAPLNRNRTKKTQKTSGAWSIETTPVQNKVSENATITGDGTVLDGALVGVGKDKGTGQSRALAEWVLYPNTVYSIRLTGLVDNGKAGLQAIWYEHIDKD